MTDRTQVDITTVEPGVSLRVVIRGAGVVYGEVAPSAKLSGDRICIVAFGGLNVVARIADIERAEVVALTRSAILKIADEQRRRNMCQPFKTQPKRGTGDER